MLAEVYRQGVEVSQYWISEKFDGVRARWDGKQLISRGGKGFGAPVWFTENFPTMQLDGELWVGRGRYEEVSSIVRRSLPHEGWRKIRFLVFDLPEHGGSFDQRVVVMPNSEGGEIEVGSNGDQLYSAHFGLGEFNMFNV